MVYSDPKAELFFSMIGIWWAVVLFLNPQLFNDIPEIYESIANVAQEKVWGFVFIGSVIITILGLCLDNGTIRKLGLSVNSLLNAMICVGYIYSAEPLSIGTGVFFAMTLLAFWKLREVRLLYAKRSTSIKTAD